MLNELLLFVSSTRFGFGWYNNNIVFYTIVFPSIMWGQFVLCARIYDTFPKNSDWLLFGTCVQLDCLFWPIMTIVVIPSVKSHQGNKLDIHRGSGHWHSCWSRANTWINGLELSRSGMWGHNDLWPKARMICGSKAELTERMCDASDEWPLWGSKYSR